MNKIITLLLFVFSISLSAQTISGKAYYSSNTATDRDYSEMPEEKRLRLEKRDKDLYEKKYVLTFNKMESIYKEEEALEETSQYMMGYLAAVKSYFIESIYKNHETQRIVEEREFLGKKFLINDTLPKLDWQLEKKSKQIGDYTVFKASAAKKVNLSDYRAGRFLDKDSTNKENLANVIVTAWYTPQIPVSDGPDEYSGLPGLILELNVDRTTFLCSKIILNSEKEKTIKHSKNGEIVTFEQFDKIVADKKKELNNRF